MLGFLLAILMAMLPEENIAKSNTNGNATLGEPEKNMQEPARTKTALIEKLIKAVEYT